MSINTWGDDDAENWTCEDWSDDADDDEPDEDEPVNCPECGGPISSFSDKCSKCGYWLTDADRRGLRPSESLPAWQKFTAAIIILAFLVCLLVAGLTIF
jgi:hypothetical protein